MATRFLLPLAWVPVVLSGVALSALAQTPAPATEQPLAVKDKATIESAFTRADANSDGKLGKDEAAKLPGISAKFDALDKNKDGVLSADEFAAAFTGAH